MKIERVHVRNFRSAVDATFEMHDYTLLVGANNCGKSTLINALRAFYEEIKWSVEDWPKAGAIGDEAWIEVTYRLTGAEEEGLPDKYRHPDRILRVRKFLKGAVVKTTQSNIYAYLPDGTLETTLFFGAKNISQAKLGSVVYVPALSVPNDHLKMSGPSPLRDILSFILKRMVSTSPAYTRLQEAFTELNEEASAKEGMLTDLVGPMNKAISDWGISLALDVRTMSPDDLAKSLIQHSFNDSAFGEKSNLPIERFGHGFQRTFIYELIRLAPSFKEPPSEANKKEFNPDLSLILFEEPEAFLHPDQQINMALSLRHLSREAGQQVLITTHSPIFVGKSSDDLCQIVRIAKLNGISEVHQLTREQLSALFGEGRRLAVALTEFVNDNSVPENKKGSANRLLQNMPTAEIAEAEERFRYQLWLDGDRAGIFFASKVVICEGASERALFNYLLENDWFDLRPERISVLDALGKFNIHRYLALLDAFAIPHSVVMDGDNGDAHHAAINALIENMCGKHALCEPFQFPSDLEGFLGLPKPPGHRNDRKPVEILKAISNNAIDASKLEALKAEFKRVCGTVSEPEMLAAE